MKQVRHFEGREVSGLSFSDKTIADWSFLSCRFIRCNFSGVKLKKCQFNSCQFIECDGSNMELGRSQFVDVNFNECKLLGVDWSEAAYPLKIAFQKSRLDYNVFFNLNLSGIEFLECLLRDAFFQRCDLTRSSFYGSDLTRAHFEECKLNYADLTDSISFNISSDNNDIAYAILSIDSALMLLRKYKLTIR